MSTIQNIINKYRIHKLKMVVHTIKEKYNEYPIEIYIYGSYLFKKFFKDIDIAIIVYSSQKSKNFFDILAIDIENHFSISGFNLDITVLTENEIKQKDGRFIPLILNILSGEKIYSSSLVKRSLDKNISKNLNYLNILRVFFYEAKNSESHPYEFIMKSYAYFIYVIAYILYSEGYSFYGVNDLTNKFRNIVQDKEIRKKILLRFMLLQKQKNSELSLETNSYKEIMPSTLQDLELINNSILDGSLLN